MEDLIILPITILVGKCQRLKSLSNCFDLSTRTFFVQIKSHYERFQSNNSGRTARAKSFHGKWFFIFLKNIKLILAFVSQQNDGHSDVRLFLRLLDKKNSCCFAVALDPYWGKELDSNPRPDRDTILDFGLFPELFLIASQNGRTPTRARWSRWPRIASRKFHRSWWLLGWLLPWRSRFESLRNCSFLFCPNCPA